MNDVRRMGMFEAARRLDDVFERLFDGERPLLGDQFRLDVVARYDALRSRIAAEQVQALDVARLGEVAKGLRLGAIEAAGIQTVRQVLESSRLTALPGVGPKTAQQVVAAARQVLAAAEQVAKVRFDIEERAPEQAYLLHSLRSYQLADAAARALQPHELWLAGFTPNQLLA